MAWVSRASGSFSGFKGDKYSFAEHVALEIPAGFWGVQRRVSQGPCLHSAPSLEENTDSHMDT